MNVRLAALMLFVPNRLKAQKLRELFALTADAFQSPSPVPDAGTYDALLRAYAVFTRDAALRCLNQGDDLSSVRKRLFEGALRLGQMLREQLHVRNFTEARRAAGILYRAIGIDFHSNDRGEVRIERCFFGGFYSPDVCHLISALDRGLIAGLSGGGRLTFQARITEGNTRCLAKIQIEN